MTLEMQENGEFSVMKMERHYMERWNRAVKMVQEAAKHLEDCPESVIATAAGPILDYPEKVEEILEKVRQSKTKRELVKSMQVYYHTEK